MEIGIDCIDIKRFNEDILSNKKLLEKIFTKNEIDYCKGKAKPEQHFAGRYAGKEATIKAFSHYNIKLPYNQIEILNDDKGRPIINILNEKYKYFVIKISISHSNELAIATVLIAEK